VERLCALDVVAEFRGRLVSEEVGVADPTVGVLAAAATRGGGRLAGCEDGRRRLARQPCLEDALHVVDESGRSVPAE